MKTLFFVLLLFFLTSCTTAGPITYISYGKSIADLISYLTTEKTTTEHGMDFITGQDCKFSYVFEEKDLKQVCRERVTIDHLKAVHNRLNNQSQRGFRVDIRLWLETFLTVELGGVSSGLPVFIEKKAPFGNVYSIVWLTGSGILIKTAALMGRRKNRDIT